MARVYTVQFENVSVSAAQDLWEITPADDKPVRLMGFVLGNVGGTADAGDAQEEMLRINVRRGFTTSGSGGSAPTPGVVDPNNAAAGFTAEVNNTTVANTGTNVDLPAMDWNVRSGLREFWPEEFQPQASQANTTIVIRLMAAPADAVSTSGCLWVVEL